MRYSDYLLKTFFQRTRQMGAPMMNKEDGNMGARWLIPLHSACYGMEGIWSPVLFLTNVMSVTVNERSVSMPTWRRGCVVTKGWSFSG